MALIDINVNKSDEAKLKFLMDHIRDRLSPAGLAALMRADVYREMKDRVSDRFNAEGDTTVGAWAPLSEATENIREDLGFPRDHPINERTGSLRHFVETSHVVGPMATGAELAMPGPFTSQLIETKFRRAQQGKARGGSKDARRTMPRRPVLAIGQVEYDLVNDRVKRFVDRTIRGS
jgi:hypothetical protein